jgi:hypothetical protein
MEAPKTVADVLNDRLREMAGPLFVCLITCPLDSTEGDDCLPTRLLRCHASGHVSLHLLLQVELNLLIDLMMSLGRKQETKTSHPLLHQSKASSDLL